MQQNFNFVDELNSINFKPKNYNEAQHNYDFDAFQINYDGDKNEGISHTKISKEKNNNNKTIIKNLPPTDVVILDELQENKKLSKSPIKEEKLAIKKEISLFDTDLDTNEKQDITTTLSIEETKNVEIVKPGNIEELFSNFTSELKKTKNVLAKANEVIKTK